MRITCPVVHLWHKYEWKRSCLLQVTLFPQERRLATGLRVGRFSFKLAVRGWAPHPMSHPIPVWRGNGCEAT